MEVGKALIVFIDNTIFQIFESLDGLSSTFKNIQTFTSEKEGLEFIYKNSVDVLFLNLDLLHNDAVSLTKEVKLNPPASKPFVIIYSDKQDDYVQEMVFNAGADSFIDFHNKPAILQLFIKNLLRRRINQKKAAKKTIVIDTEQHLVFKNGEPFQLPKKEFKVFELLSTNTTKFFSKEEIALLIWKDEEIAKKRIIDVHIYNIRRHFGKRIIQSQKGKGYRLNIK